MSRALYRCLSVVLPATLGVSLGFAAENGTPAGTNAPAPPAAAAVPAPATNAPATTAESKPNDRNIRFQFDGLPYADAVARFAQMVNKPLVTDTKVEGTLSFSDPQPYTYAEALETLNLVLSLKGVMLVEADRYLRLVPLKDITQMPLRIFRGLDQTGDATPGEVATVILTLQNLDASEIAQSISSMLSNAGSVAPLSRGRGLIITDRLSNIKRVQALLKEVDTASPVKREMKTYTLLNASGSVLVDLINRTFGLSTAPRRVEFNQQTKSYHQLPPDANDYITAVFDDASRTLVLFGPADRVQLAETLIKRFEDKSGVAAGDVRVFYPQSTSSMELARMLRQAMPTIAAEGDNSPATITKARLIVDISRNRLIVTAPAAGQLEEVEKLVKRIDIGAETGQGQGTNAVTNPITRLLKPFALKYTSANSVATMLMQLYGREYRMLDPRLRVLATASNDDKTLLVEATQAMLDHIAEAIRILDVEPTQGIFEVRTYQLTGANASELGQTLNRLFSERQGFQRKESGLTLRPRFEVDSNSNTLIVAATKEQFEQIDQLVKELRASVEVATEIRTFQLKFCQPEQMVQLLDTMLRDQVPVMQGRFRSMYQGAYGSVADFGKLRIATAPALNAVILQGPPDKLRLAEQLITTLDKEKTDPVSTIQIVHLKEAKPDSIAQVVTTTMASRATFNQTRRVTIIPVPSSSTLLVDGPSGEVEEAMRLIQELDKESSSGSVEFRVYHVQNSNAQETYQLLNQMLAGLSRSQTKSGRATIETPPMIAVDSRSNSLIISATPELAKIIDKLLQQLDTTQPSQRVMHIVQVKSGRPTELASRVRPLYLDQIRNAPDVSGPEALILPDEANSRLILTATAPQLKLIEDLITQLDVVPDDSDRQLKRIALLYTSANWMSTMLQQLYSREFRTENPKMRLVLTPTTDDRTLVLDAPATLLERLEGVIKSLDAEPSRGTFEVRTYQLNAANATELVQTLTRLFAERQDWQKREPGPVTQPRFEADLASNCIIVAATKEQFTQIDLLIKELRASVEVATEIRTFRLKYCDPEQMLQLLDTMLREQTPATVQNRYRGIVQGNFGPVSDYGKLRIATAPALNAVVLQGPPDKLRLAEQLITTLDKEKADCNTVIRTVHLKKAQAEAVAEAVNKTLDNRAGKSQARRAMVTPVATSNSLLIEGPDAEMEEILKVIQDLDQESTNGTLEFHIYRIENGNAQEVSRILSQMLQGLASTRSRFGRANEQFPVTVAVDDRSNSLIVSATAESFKIIDKLLTTLNQTPKRADRAMNLYTLINADPFTLASKLQSLYADRPKEGQVTAEADAYSSAITVVAPRQDFPEIEEMIRRIDQAAVDTSLQVRMVVLEKIPAAQMLPMLTNIYSQVGGGQIKLLDRLPPRSRERSAFRSTPISLNATNISTNTVALAQTNETQAAASATAALILPAGGLFFPEVVVAVDKTANALLLSGPSHELDQIQSIIRDLSRAAASNDTELRMYPLEEADPLVVARTLNELFGTGQPGLGGGGGFGYGRFGRRAAQAQAQPPQPGQPAAPPPPPRIMVVPEPRTRSIIIRAQPNDFALVEPLIKQLDVAGLNAQLGFRLVPLENVHPDKLLPLAMQMISQLRMARPGEPVTVSSDPRGNALFIVARNTLLDQVEKMIQELDTPSEYAEAEVLILPLKNANASQLATILRSMLQPGTRGETSPEARELQEQVRRLKIQNERGEAIVLELAKPIKIMADPIQGTTAGANRLLLISTPDNLKAMAAVVGMMDTVPSMANIRIFPLHHADASTLQHLITELYAGPAFSKMRPEDRPNVAVDDRTDSLIVSGNETAFSVVTNLLCNLDQEGAAIGGQIRLVPLKHATAQTLSAALSTLFVQRYQAARTPDALRRRPIIIPDPRSNSLLISAGNEDNQAIDALLEKLDRKPENAAVSITVIGLHHNDPARVASMLTSVFAAHRQSITAPGQVPAPQDQVHVEADPLTSAVIITASPENLELVKNLLAQVDVEPVAQEGLIQTFTLKQADAQRAAAMLRSLVDQGIYRPGIMSGNRRSARDAIAVTVDPRSNTLIISASPENLLVVKALIKQIDSVDCADSGDIKLFQLKHAKASQLASVLEQFFRSKRSGETAAGTTERSIPVTVTPDDRTSTLLVTGGRETFAAVERMILQLDAEQVIPRTNFKVFALKQATAAKLQSTLTQLFARRPPTIRGEPPDPITIVEDSWANALIVGACPDDLNMVESLINQLDSNQDAGMEVQVLPLVKADARQVAQTITTLYRSGGPGTTSPVTANVDERINAVIVSAGQNDIKRIAELVRKLDTDQVTQVHEIRVFTLTNSRAVQLSAILTSVLNTKPTALNGQSPSRQALLQFIARSQDGKELLTSALKEGIIIAPDPRANALVVSAPVEYMRLLHALIAHLDACAPQVATIRVFALKNADARQMMNVLTSLFHLQPNVAPSSQPNNNNRTIQYNLVRNVPDEEAFITGQTEVAASGVVGTAEENALTVTVDIRSNSLLVGGTEHYVTLAAEIIDTLDSSPAQERKSEVYRLKNSRALDIQSALQNFLRQDTQLLIAAMGQQAMAQEVLDRQATIVAETNSNTLLISATPRNFNQVSNLVAQLDQPQRQVLIQVLLAEVTLTKGDELGVEWTYQSGGNPSTKTGTDFGLPNALKNYGGFASSISGDSFNFLFRALDTEGRLQVLSRPQILTADNQLATIKVGQQVPIVDTTQIIGLNGNTVSSFKYQDVGVTLTVTPRISPDGFVKMDVSPQITQLSSSTAQISSGFQAPIINQRLATTAVSVQSGQSILIGGLISTTDDNTTKYMPFLGHIPLLGALFRSNIRNTTRTELLILLTPQVLINGEAMPTTNSTLSVTREQLNRATIKGNFKKDDLERQMLEPLYPELKTNAPSAILPGDKSKNKPETNK